MLVDMYKTRPFMPNVAPSYNVAPTHNAMVVVADADKKEREPALLKWG
jgi:putative SOS response-associated peptidase YedK